MTMGLQLKSLHLGLRSHLVDDGTICGMLGCAGRARLRQQRGRLRDYMRFVANDVSLKMQLVPSS